MADTSPKRILLVFHNLNVEGAPTMLVQASRILSDYHLEAISFQDGPYREVLSKMKIPVKVFPHTPDYFKTAGLTEYVESFDLIIANTILTYDFVKYFGNTVPILWYIHEGKTIETIFARNIPELPKLLKTAAHIVVVSEYVRDWLQGKYGITSVTVLHNYISMESVPSCQAPLRSGPVRFTYLGSIDPNKGLDILLEANHRLADRQNTVIQYAGNILNQDYYQRLQSKYTEENQQYWGLVVKEKKTELFNQTDVFVVPSRDESCSLVTLEALYAGKPVIISNCVGAKYAVTEDCGWIFDIRNVDTLTTIMADISSGKYDLNSYGRNAKRQYALHASLEHYKEGLCTLVDKCIGKRDVENSPQCTDCGACRSVCPTAAIHQAENDEGFLYPQIDRQKCISCGKCVDICPVIHPKYENQVTPECYAAYADEPTRAESSSGGLFPVLANAILNQGGYICGAVYDEHFKVHHIVTADPEEVRKMRGSKYVQSDTGYIFQEIRQILETGAPILFTGVSCQVAGLKAFLKKPYANLYCVDILCHGAPSPGVFRKYLSEEFAGEQIQSIQFRDKQTGGWHDFHIVVLTDKRELNQPLLENGYAAAFLHNMINRPCCADCRFQKLPRQGDITIGDFWGIEDCAPELDDNKGTSLVLVNSEKGKALLAQCRQDLPVLEPQEVLNAQKKNPNIVSSSIPHPNRNTYFDKLPWRTVSECTDQILNQKFDAVIMNYWYAKNYGATITCYALYRLLEKEHIDVRVLNYIPELFKPIYSGSFSERFAQQYFRLTPQCVSLKDLSVLNDLTDTFIVGSDQVWNPNIYPEHGGNIFQLSFTRPEKRRIGCAVSFGQQAWESTTCEKETFAALIRDFTAISVREESGKDILLQEFDTESENIGDPVFALSAAEWHELGSKDPLYAEHTFASYILAGGHGDVYPAWIQNALKSAADKFHKPATELKFANDYSVEQWISAIASSDFVVTDSFHAACFSIIFNKPLIYLLNNPKLYGRLENVFHHFQIHPLVVTEDNWEKTLEVTNFPEDNFSYANAQLQADRIHFRNWLTDALHAPIPETCSTFLRELLQAKYADADSIAALTQQVDTLRREIDDIYNSHSWKLIRILQRILDFFRGRH